MIATTAAKPRSQPETAAPGDRMTAWLLGLGAIVAPVALGCTGAWARFALEVAMAVVVIVWACGSRRGIAGLVLPLAVAGIAFLQIVPLADSLLVAVAPVSAGAWKVALAGQPDAWGRISVDPALTVVGICRLLLGAATVAVVADLAANRANRRVLTGCLAVSCLVLWTLGLVFPFNRSLVLLGFIDFRGPIASEYWRTPIAPPVATNGSGVLDVVTVGGQRYQVPSWVAVDGFGSYICSNHFAGAMCLTLPALLCIWLGLSRGRLPHVVRYTVVLSTLAAALWTVGAMAQSRAGTAALAVGSLALISLVAESPWVRRVGWIITGMACATLLVFLAALYGPLSSLASMLPTDIQRRFQAMLVDGRAAAARAALRMFLASPMLGTGLGTYGELLPRFFRHDMVVYFAHNDYAQLLAETGLAGLAMLTAGGGVLFRRLRDFMRCWSTESVTAAAAWAALVGIAVHSFFDWNLHVPANALLACIVAGLAIGQSAERGSLTRSAASSVRTAATTTATAVLAAACLAATGFLLREAVTETTLKRLRAAITADRIARTDPTAPAAATRLDEAIAAGERMASWNPARAQLAVTLGQACLHAASAAGAANDGAVMQASAERWFRTARHNSAAVPGIPEPSASQ